MAQKTERLGRENLFVVSSSSFIFIYFWQREMAGEHSAGDEIREVTCKDGNVCRPATVAKMSQ